jgi:beta-lysine 5,6-aminomutase beta subunit
MKKPCNIKNKPHPYGLKRYKMFEVYNVYNIDSQVPNEEFVAKAIEVNAVGGGPRVTHELAKELGYDAGFGPGTFAEDVGAFITQEWVRRFGNKK